MRVIFLFFLLPCFLWADIPSYAPLIPKGCRTVSTSFARFETEHFYGKHGQIKKSYNHFIRDQINVAIEYGISSKNSIALWSAFDLIHDHLNGNAYRLEDAELRFKQALFLKENSILAAEAIAIIPYENRYYPEVRYGRIGAEGALLYAQTFFPNGVKTTLDVRMGYRWYSGFPSDQIRSAITVWSDLSCRWQLLAQMSVEYGIFNGKEPFNRSFFFYNANYRVCKGRLEAIYYITEKLALSAGYMRHFYGQNIAFGGEWSARLAFCF